MANGTLQRIILEDCTEDPLGKAFFLAKRARGIELTALNFVGNRAGCRRLQALRRRRSTEAYAPAFPLTLASG